MTGLKPNPIDPQASEPDTWTSAELDIEPERCWCLRCGAELPCSDCPPQAISDNQHKETTHVY